MSEKELKPKIKGVNYAIAGLVIQINLFDDFDIDRLLPTFVAFKVDSYGDLPVISQINLHFRKTSFEEDNHKLLSDISESWGDSFRLYEKDQQYITLVRGKGSDCIMRSDRYFHDVELVLSPREELVSIVSWFLMVVFAQAGLLHKTILFHSSVVEYDQGAYAFLGKSGTGKVHIVDYG